MMSNSNIIEQLRREINYLERQNDRLGDISYKRVRNFKVPKQGFFESDNDYWNRFERIQNQHDSELNRIIGEMNANDAKIKALKAQIEQLLQQNNKKDF